MVFAPGAAPGAAGSGPELGWGGPQCHQIGVVVVGGWQVPAPLPIRGVLGWVTAPLLAPRMEPLCHPSISRPAFGGSPGVGVSPFLSPTPGCHLLHRPHVGWATLPRKATGTGVPNHPPSSPAVSQGGCPPLPSTPRSILPPRLCCPALPSPPHPLITAVAKAGGRVPGGGRTPAETRRGRAAVGPGMPRGPSPWPHACVGVGARVGADAGLSRVLGPAASST